MQNRNGRRNRKRTAVWSVPEEWQRLYFFLFSAQFVVVTVLIAWREIAGKETSSWPDTLIAIGQTVSSLTIGIAAESIILTEAVFMVLALWLMEKRYNEGVAKTQKAWEEWNRRREQAVAEGREFTEPPPNPEPPDEAN